MTDTPDEDTKGNGADVAADDDAAAEAPAPTADERLAEAQAERDEMKDRMLRVAAEFENWKKRARKEQGDAEARTREGVLKDMLEVVDNLQRATAAYGEGDGQAADGNAI